jgi:hypothetical protein
MRDLSQVRRAVFLESEASAVPMMNISRKGVEGRKNFYGNCSELGAAVAGLFFSSLGTAQKLGLNPEEYLTIASLRASHPGTLTLTQDYQAELDTPS